MGRGTQEKGEERGRPGDWRRKLEKENGIDANHRQITEISIASVSRPCEKLPRFPGLSQTTLDTSKIEYNKVNE